MRPAKYLLVLEEFRRHEQWEQKRSAIWLDGVRYGVPAQELALLRVPHDPDQFFQSLSSLELLEGKVALKDGNS